MSDVHIDPEMVDDFAGKLKSFATTLEENISNLRAGLSRLKGTWRDQEYDAFAREFEQAERLLRRLKEETEKTVPRLHSDAEAARRIHEETL